MRKSKKNGVGRALLISAEEYPVIQLGGNNKPRKQIITFPCWIWGSNSDGYQNFCLLEFNAV
jgi:hypothetical protein